MANGTIVFIHGYTASARSDWYPAIAKKLTQLHIPCVIPNLPGGRKPHAREWVKILHEVIASIPTPIILVGHSLGTRAALLYLEQYQPARVEKVFLIAAFANRLENAKRRNEYYADFFAHTININAIRLLAKAFYVLHSIDDTSIPYEQGVEIANDLHATLIPYTDRNHFSNPKNAPEILTVLRKELVF